ncbi:hypothetical protein AJ80_00170 [Polytolypa hystricis UAMH7299]|uniref:Uncharacterized protein n=1 Tax=Polytolypa hystricis (strain UAMH7299) TaxID=1447883 RepID=A0A2B7Z4V4_POLH7|nr:hypothetical protein AJ80_00170 [Polytolypa hystricis UAMH7299]
MSGNASSNFTPGTSPHPLIYQDILSFAFDNRPVGYDEQQPIYISADNPSWALTAKQFRVLVRSLIAGFRAHGLQKGDCVLVNLPNNVLYSAIFFSIIGAGGVYMGINPRSQRYEMQHFLRLAEPRMLITSPDGIPMLRNVLRSGLSQVCVLDDSSIKILSDFLASRSSQASENCAVQTDEFERGIIKFSSLLNAGENDWIRFDGQFLAESTPATMFTTSGTGGLPKAAILSHFAIVSHHLAIQYNPSYNVTRLISLPMFHLFGASFSHIFPIRYGQPLYILDQFDAEQYAHLISVYGITETYMVPTMVQMLNRLPSRTPAKQLWSLRYVGVSAASIDACWMSRFREKLMHPDGQISQLWGMTEVGTGFQIRYGDRDDTGSVGRLLFNYEAKLVDNNGAQITCDGQPGELYIRGPGTLTGYRGKGIGECKDTDGWFRTGDVLYVRNGKFYIVGRSKELIKVRGWQVAPAEIEAVLLKHPDIADAAVIGIAKWEYNNANNSSGSILSALPADEMVRAYVVRRRETSHNPTSTSCPSCLTADDVYQFSKSQLASYKALDGGVIFVEEIPRTASGKIQRFKLAQMNYYRDMVSSMLLGDLKRLDSVDRGTGYTECL